VKFEFLSERFGEKLTGDPNAPAGVLGPPIPPLYSCQNLRIVCKKAGLIRRFPSVLDRFSSKQFPPSSQQEAHSIEGTDPCLKKSVQNVKPVISIRAFEASRTVDP
jgi:hypothetical protein